MLGWQAMNQKAIRAVSCLICPSPAGVELMALAASACILTHPASYLGKGSFLQILFLEVICLCSLPHTGWLAASHCLQRLGQALGSYAGHHGKQVRAGDTGEMPVPKSPGSGEGSHNLPHRLRVTLGSEPRGPKKHRGVDLCRNIGMNNGEASSQTH